MILNDVWEKYLDTLRMTDPCECVTTTLFKTYPVPPLYRHMPAVLDLNYESKSTCNLSSIAASLAIYAQMKWLQSSIVSVCVVELSVTCGKERADRRYKPISI